MTRGGKRPGAGRPAGPQNLKKIQVNYKLPRWLVEKIRAMDEPAALIIEAAVVEKFGWETPPPDNE